MHVDSESGSPEGVHVNSDSESPEGVHDHSESESPQGMPCMQWPTCHILLCTCALAQTPVTCMPQQKYCM